MVILLIFDWIHTKYKKYRGLHSCSWAEFEEIVNLGDECQSLDKFIKELNPDWYKYTSKNVRWTIYMNVLNSKDGDDNGTQKNK